MEQCGRVSYWRELLDTVLWRTISTLLSDDGGGEEGTFKPLKRPGEWQGPSFYPGHSVCVLGPQWLEPCESSDLPVAEDIQPIPRAQIPRGALGVG